MKQIGFRNYKRFKELMPLELGRVTLVVGANNSGKSTFLKGLLLTNENTINLSLPQSYGGKEKFDGFLHPVFTFDLNTFDAGISNFERSLSTDAKEHRINFFISLPLATESKKRITSIDPCYIGFEIEISVQADTKEDAERGNGLISTLSVHDLGRQLFYKFDFLNGVVSFKAKQINETSPINHICADNFLLRSDNIFADAEAEMDMLRYTIKQAKNNEALTIFQTEFKLENNIRSRREDDGIYTHSVIAKYVENIAETILKLIYKDRDGVNVQKEQKEFMFQFKNEDDTSEIEIANKLLKFNPNIVSIIKESAKALDEAIAHEARIMYLPIHSISRHVLYNANDKNDFVAQSIRNYMLASSNRNKKREMKKLVKQWMRMFEIGEDFTIKNVEGEYYSFRVTNIDKKTVNLADLGTGAIQLIVMFLNIATIVDHNMMKTQLYSEERATFANIPTIIIEEPEQNLHPLFQSRLADFFYNISQGLNVIVETHSEYLIRRVQVIQANAHNASVDNNQKGILMPFKIYYFPHIETPYEMKLREDGKFMNDFGPGFFDIAGDLAFELF